MTAQNLDLSKPLLDQIVQKILEELSPVKIVLFGSSAYGQTERSSDIDIALFGVSQDAARLIQDRLNEELDTLKNLDVVSFDCLKNSSLKENILKKGIVLYERSLKP